MLPCINLEPTINGQQARKSVKKWKLRRKKKKKRQIASNKASLYYSRASQVVQKALGRWNAVEYSIILRMVAVKKRILARNTPLIKQDSIDIQNGSYTTNHHFQRPYMQ